MIAQGMFFTYSMKLHITYDEIGNPLTWFTGFDFTLTQGRRLASASRNDLDISYSYDANGIRASKTVNGVETKYTVNGSAIIREERPGLDMVFEYDVLGKRTNIIYNGETYYYIRNLQGDVRAIVDSSLDKVVEYVYDPWGQVLSVTGSMADTLGQDNPFRYRGYYFDVETGLYYLENRYYDPVVGRFINADAVLVELNMFYYCGNNPINREDPSGLYIQMISPEDAIRILGLVGDGFAAITAPARQFGTAIGQDIVNFNLSNTDEQKVLDSNYFSFYKGIPVFRFSGDRSASFGMMFISNSTKVDADTVKHEWGHTIQMRYTGVLNYIPIIAIPSINNQSGADYYRQPCEVTADYFGGVSNRPNHNSATTSDIIAGLKLIGAYIPSPVYGYGYHYPSCSTLGLHLESRGICPG